MALLQRALFVLNIYWQKLKSTANEDHPKVVNEDKQK